MAISFNTNSFIRAYRTKEKINNINTLNSSIGNSSFGKKNEYKVYFKTDDMLYSGGSGNGLSFTIKYAENSSKENPVVIAKGIDENGKEFEQTFNINDIDMTKASIIEMRALENHLRLDKAGWFSTLPFQSSTMDLNDKNDFIEMFEDAIKEQITLGQYDFAMRYKRNLKFLYDFTKNQQNFTEILRQYFINHPQSLDKYAFLRNSAFTHWVKEKCSKIC